MIGELVYELSLVLVNGVRDFELLVKYKLTKYTSKIAGTEIAALGSTMHNKMW